LVDETYFFETKALVTSLLSQGVLESNIDVLIYKDKLKK
jgi:hypothetical protein